MPTFLPHNQTDQNKEPQWAYEGDFYTTIALYGANPTDPGFEAAGPEGARLVSTTAPEIKVKRKAGNANRIGQTLVKKKFTAQVIQKISAANENDIKWAMHKAVITVADTPAFSRLYVKSYDVAGTETYETFHGCLPTSASLTITKNDELLLTIDMVCNDIIETQSANGNITLGSGSFASANTETPYLASDGGLNSLLWNGVAEAEDGFTVTVTHDWSELDPSESLKTLAFKEGLRIITGSVDIPIQNLTPSTDARAVTSRAMVRTLKAAGLTATFTNAVFDPPHSGQDHDPESSAQLLYTKSFSANDVAFA